MHDEHIRLILVDDHAIVRRGLHVSINSYEDIVVVAQGRNGEEAIQLCKEHQPDILLLDLMLPGLSGIDVINELHQDLPQLKIIILTNFKDPELVHGALEAGALSYLLKDVTVKELVKTIRMAHEGKPILAPEATQVLIHEVTRPKRQDFDLTDRELEIIRLLIEGLSNPEIGARLHISRSTVKNHVSRIIAKMDVSSRTEVATKAMKLKLIDF